VYKLLLDGRKRFEILPEFYWRLAFPNSVHSFVPQKYIYTMPFSIKPEDIQPAVCSPANYTSPDHWCAKGKKHFAPEVTEAEYAQMWKDAGCTTKANYSTWVRQQTRQTLQNDVKAWATLTSEEHRKGCYGDDKTKWPASYSLEKATDYWFNDAPAYFNTNPAACEKTCSENDWCVGFVFNPEDKSCRTKFALDNAQKKTNVANRDTYKRPNVIAATVIPDTRSSNGTANGCSPTDSKLNAFRGWCAIAADVKYFMEFDFGANNYVVTDIKMQGRGDYPQWVNKFQLWYQQEPNSEWVFMGDYNSGITNTNEIRTIPVNKNATARKIRIHPVTWNAWPSMRVEFVGKKSTKVVKYTPPKK
jgi:hypothetical protein